ncbi:hypothetical protein L1987_55048 [Smallanthus sonchifolius]|uniref:Uncharacterized protein n=1 Tax=Smallanthus sonchifolius TaxID=185202 RepID=A0ACB9E8U6_9ASTR|nr:hypothetical protein L1987_55048 [Smallanthus sonchifolius]
MTPFCVMCDALGNATCVAGCPYAALVKQQRVVNHYATHQEMAILMEFLCEALARVENMTRFFVGLRDKLSQKVAKKEAEILKLEAQLSTRKKQNQALVTAVAEKEAKLDVKLRQLAHKQARISELEAAVAAHQKPERKRVKREEA